MDSIFCDSCGAPPKYPLGKDTVSFTCSTCLMGRAHLQRQKEKEELSSLTREEIKAARKKYKMTQKDLDMCLDLPTNHTNRVENGHELPKKRLYNFVQEINAGKTPKALKGRKKK